MKHEQKMSIKKLAARAACLSFALACAASASAQQTSSSYRGAQRDPFEKRKFIPKKMKQGPSLVEPPAIETRIQAYKAQKAAAMNAQLPAPKATTAFLVNEVQVTGIFRTPRGWAAMVQAKPIKLSYVIYPGEAFYNGMLVAIEEDRLVFRREIRWSDGRRETTVELKPLAVRNAIKDSMMTGASSAPVSAPAAVSVAASATDDQSVGGGADSAASAAHGRGRAVPSSGERGFDIWKYRDQFGEMGEKCKSGSTISFKPDGTIVCTK